jgi:Trk K+ transport system NAD-binding subunit
VITNEVEATTTSVTTKDEGDLSSTKPFLEPPKSPTSKGLDGPSDATVGTTLDSILEVTPEQCMRIIYSIEDAVRGTPSNYNNSSQNKDRIIVTRQKGVLILAVDAPDRPGLLLDISKCLARLHLDLLHTEAAVLEGRSLSIWRGHPTDDSEAFLIEVWSALHALIANDVGAGAIKQRGLQVIRASVRDGGRLVGKNASQVDFRALYKAAIVAIRTADGKTYTETLSKITLEKGDQVVLQVSDNSPLLELPPEHFYSPKTMGSNSHKSSITNLFGMAKKGSGGTNHNADSDAEMDRVENAAGIQEKEAAWNDLQVLKADNSVDSLRREFMTAMKVADGSGLVGKTAVQAGIDKLPGVLLLSLERPTIVTGSVESVETVPLSSSLQEGDVLWFAGSANTVGDLRKIPGLVLNESDEVAKMEEHVQNRRLVEAVVARGGPLVGKTVKEVHFR